MASHGLVDKVNIAKTWNDEIIVIDISNMRITPEGIDYLHDNDKMRKLAELLPEFVGAIAEFFIN